MTGPNPNIRGERNHLWKGGRSFDKENGYILIYSPDHPHARSARYMYEHILVYEGYYKCYMLDWGVVHHKNGIKTDNRIENLEGMMLAEHHRHHTTELWRTGRFDHLKSIFRGKRVSTETRTK